MERETRILIKEVIIAALSVTASGVAFLLWRRVIPELAAGNFHTGLLLASALGALILAATLFILTAMFIERPPIAYASAVISTGAPYFFFTATLPIIAVLCASIGISVLAVYKIRREFSLSMGFSVSKISKSGIALFFTVFAISASLLYTQGRDERQPLAFLIPKPAFDATLPYLFNSQFMRSLTGLPQIKPDITADELLDIMLRRQLENQGLTASKVTREEMIRLKESGRREIARQYRISFKGNEKVQDLFYGLIADRADELLGPYRRYIPLVSALAFFFAFKTLSLPLSLLSLASAFLLIRTMLFATILTRATKDITVERITF